MHWLGDLFKFIPFDQLLDLFSLGWNIFEGKIFRSACPCAVLKLKKKNHGCAWVHKWIYPIFQCNSYTGFNAGVSFKKYKKS